MWGISHLYISPFLFPSFSSQDGKTAEDLAYADQHEPIVSLLGKLKKVKGDTYTKMYL